MKDDKDNRVLFFSSSLKVIDTCIKNMLYLYSEIRYIDIANYGYNEQIILVP